MYGLPKVHKSGTPLRPIISAVGTYNYKPAKYLNSILAPLVQSPLIIKDTFDFVGRVRTMDKRQDKYLVSFDVESLFTNVPTLETIEILLELAFSNEEQTSFHGMSREELRYLLIVCTQESHFQFDGKYYDQIDGVAMGSPLGPLFANAFMSNFENKHMEKLQELGVVKWWRFVDDVFATVGSDEQVQSIVDYLNKQHPNIKFTFEREANNRLPFLDTAVVRRLNDYGTTVYRKKTYTGVYTNWTSLTARR